MKNTQKLYPIHNFMVLFMIHCRTLEIVHRCHQFSINEIFKNILKYLNLKFFLYL